jgi:hypothetical protein
VSSSISRGKWRGSTQGLVLVLVSARHQLQRLQALTQGLSTQLAHHSCVQLMEGQQYSMVQAYRLADQRKAATCGASTHRKRGCISTPGCPQAAVSVGAMACTPRSPVVQLCAYMHHWLHLRSTCRVAELHMFSCGGTAAWMQQCVLTLRLKSCSSSDVWSVYSGCGGCHRQKLRSMLVKLKGQ